jgi:hypothetical protein
MENFKWKDWETLPKLEAPEEPRSGDVVLVTFTIGGWEKSVKNSGDEGFHVVFKLTNAIRLVKDSIGRVGQPGDEVEEAGEGKNEGGAESDKRSDIIDDDDFAM